MNCKKGVFMFKTFGQPKPEPNPLSLVQLKLLAEIIRKNIGYMPMDRIDPLHLVEIVIPRKIDDNFTFGCTAVEDWSYDKNVGVVCDYANNNIEIREDFYTAAYNGNTHNSFLICHEICHYLALHYLDMLVDSKNDFEKYKDLITPLIGTTFMWFIFVTDDMVVSAKKDIKKLMELSGFTWEAASHRIDLYNIFKKYKHNIDKIETKYMKKEALFMKNREKRS